MIIIQDYYYCEESSTLSVQFSIEEDGDDFYRQIEMDINEIKYYSPTIVNEYDLNDIDEDFVIELITEYLKENDPPEQLNL